MPAIQHLSQSISKKYVSDDLQSLVSPTIGSTLHQDSVVDYVSKSRENKQIRKLTKYRKLKANADVDQSSHIEKRYHISQIYPKISVEDASKVEDLARFSGLSYILLS